WVSGHNGFPKVGNISNFFRPNVSLIYLWDGHPARSSNKIILPVHQTKLSCPFVKQNYTACSSNKIILPVHQTKSSCPFAKIKRLSDSYFRVVFGHFHANP
ncbi:MAG: hypothetical protein ACKO1W_02115, partial [Microcystaceae cyanobacterium]